MRQRSSGHAASAAGAALLRNYEPNGQINIQAIQAAVRLCLGRFRLKDPSTIEEFAHTDLDPRIEAIVLSEIVLADQDPAGAEKSVRTDFPTPWPAAIFDSGPPIGNHAASEISSSCAVSRIASTSGIALGATRPPSCHYRRGNLPVQGSGPASPGACTAGKCSINC